MMRKFLILAFTALSSVNCLIAAPTCDWPIVNHDLHNTRSSPCTTISFADVQAGLVVQQWSAPGAAIQAAPVVSNGVVYYGDLGGNLFAYDIATGTQLYHYVFPNAGESVNAPPTVFGNVIYVATVSSATTPPTAAGLRLYAFDLTLTPLPTFNGGFPVDVDPGHTGVEGNILAGPVIIDNLVIVTTDNSTPQETDTLNPTYRGGFQAFNATTGGFVWRKRVSPANSGYGTSGGSFSTAGIDAKRKLMFVGTSNATTPPASPLTDALLAIDYTSGKIKWSQQYTPGDVYSFQYACGYDYDVGASPNLFSIRRKGKKIDVVGCGSKQGIYRVFRRSTGAPVWESYMIPEDAVPSIDGNPGSAYANDTVYTISNVDTSGVSYNALSVLAQYGLSSGNYNAIIQLSYYLANTDITYISAHDANTGKQKWTNHSVSATLGSITEANDVIYTGNFLGEVRAINAKNGQVHLIANLGGTIGAPITVVGNQLFIGVGLSGTGGLFVFQKQ